MTDGATDSLRRYRGLGLEVPVFKVRVLRGSDTGLEASSIDGRLTVGTNESAGLRLTDPTVSRFHLEFEASVEGIVARDLGSTNGTLHGDLGIREVVLRESSELDIGRTRVRLILEGARATITAANVERCGGLVGSSPAMRMIYDLLHKAGPSLASVLITGESGTGKEVAARVLHDSSPRAGEAFEVVDCGGLPPTLIESELFGHEKGAFTGAVGEREGAFERAHGGTLFLDELGELPIDVQPKLLRALGEGEIRRVGGKRTRAIDVRVVAATNRDLRRDINVGRFRADLFYRIAVIQLRMPPLRERLGDLPLLVPELFRRIERDRGCTAPATLDDAFWSTLAEHDWPGNIRELRNYLEHVAILRTPPPVDASGRMYGDRAHADNSQGSGAGSTPSAWFDELAQLPMRDARATLLERFDREYLARLLESTQWNIAEAARKSSVDRGTLFRIIRRHNLQRPE